MQSIECYFHKLEYVTKFEEGIDINPTVFEIPKDVDIKETKSPY